jgi:hypothetical protein
VPPDAWATVLALAALRARLRGEQALWADWEVGVSVAADAQLRSTPSRRTLRIGRRPVAELDQCALLRKPRRLLSASAGDAQQEVLAFIALGTRDGAVSRA